MQLYRSQFNHNFNHFLAILLLSVYPITFFLGTGVVNISVVLIDLILIFEIFNKKKFKIFYNITFYSLLFLWFSLLINLIFSINPENSFTRSFGFIRYIFFVMAILYYFNIYNQKYQKIVLTTWFIIFLIISLDLLYEFFLGKNILGFESYIPGRLSGFYNDELKIGHFYYGFILISLSYLFNFFSEKNLKLFTKKISRMNIVYFCIFVFLLISLMIGERSNFFRVLIMSIFFLILVDKKLLIKKILLTLSFLSIMIFIIYSNDGYKVRFINQMLKPLIKNPISYISSTSYGDHYKFGIRIFNENKLFGVGLKNYRIEVGNKNYVNASIHPHQTHIEILSELGIVGYLTFVIFFIINFLNYKKKRNYDKNFYQLAGFLFIITTFIPLLPSGSFFTSHGATLFWMNFAFMSLNIKSKHL